MATKKRRKSFKPKHRATAQDVEVGRRLRAIRKERGMSQSAVGQKLGVTFQQVQKYEKGTNRIGAGRLQALSAILGTPISAFFPEEKRPRSAKPTMFDVADAGAVALLRAYGKLSNPSLKRSLVQLASQMAVLDSR